MDPFQFDVLTFLGYFKWSLDARFQQFLSTYTFCQTQRLLILFSLYYGRHLAIAIN